MPLLHRIDRAETPDWSHLVSHCLARATTCPKAWGWRRTLGVLSNP